MRNGMRQAIVAVAAAMALGAAMAAENGEDEAAAQARRKAMLTAGRAGLCHIHYFFQQPEDEKGPDEQDAYRAAMAFQYKAFIDRHMSLLTVGLLLDNDGHVLVGDMHFEQKYIKRIEVVGPDGTLYTATRLKLLDRSPSVILKVNEPLKNWRAPAFVAQDKLTEAGKAFTVSMLQSGKDWWLTLGGLGAAWRTEGSATAPGAFISGSAGGHLQTAILQSMSNPMAFYTGTSRSELTAMMHQPSLLCNDKGAPIGVVVPGAPIRPDQSIADWEQSRLLKGPAVTFADMEKLVAQVRTDLGKKLYRCKILYRQPSGGGRYNRYDETGRTGREWITFGLAVSPTRLLVPLSIDRATAARIDKIEITIYGKTAAGEFVGAFKDMGGFLVDVKKGNLPAVEALTCKERPEPMRLFYTVSTREKFGKKYLEVLPNRWVGQTRGYKDLYYTVPVHGVPEGTLLLTPKMQVFGVYARQRMEGEELGSLAAERRYGQGAGGFTRIFWTPEVAAMLADPQASLDPQIRRKTEEEAKRLPWVGVEFTHITPELAKQLNVEKQTKDGTVGLYVNRVYKASPAQKMGLVIGDILLRVKTRKRPTPIELQAGAMAYDQMGAVDWSAFQEYQTMGRYGGKPRWKPRLNYLTILLKAIGEGENIQLTWLHDGKEITKDYTIQEAPRDFISAKKYKNKQVGLTVKDLTYEVRAALRLPDDKKAIVVAKVEPGSPAQVAKIQPYELITVADGKPVDSAAAFGEIIKNAIKARKGTVRLTIENLGKTRLADLDLTQVDATKEEPEDEK